ncbi:MAG: PadR family transcriptional regulator, partial [Planctomycetota bacterium]
MDFSQDLVRGSIVPIVLALLHERAMYGYEIVKVVNARTNGRLEWKEGTLY